MTDIYIVIRCGCEGIERLCWGGTDATIAADRVVELRSIAKPTSSYQERYKPDWDSDHDYDPDSICVQRFREGDNEFKCVCKELQVATEEPWMY